MFATTGQAQYLRITDDLSHITSLSGEVPSTIGLITQLYELDLGCNSLSSTIPSQIGGFSLATSLVIDSNRSFPKLGLKIEYTDRLQVEEFDPQ